MLRLIEIEIYNYCNRKCKFCPNHKDPTRQDRKNVQYLDFEVYKKLIYHLNMINFQKVISYSRYNEPLAFPDVTKKYVQYARDNLNCKIVANTNGDFISKDTIDIFDELSIMDYGSQGVDYWRSKLLSLGAVEQKFNDMFLHFETAKGNKVLVFLNFSDNATIEDRGGVIASDGLNMKNGQEIRKRPCYEPKYFLGVDYNGYVVPCCNINSIDHPTYQIGNIYKDSVDYILNSNKRKNIIDVMSGDNWEKYFGPCYTCQKDPGRYTRDDPGIEYKGERK